MLEYLAATAASKYFFFFSGLVLALLLIELRLNLRILFKNNDDLEYRVVLPIFIWPDWAFRHVSSPEVQQSSFQKFNLFRGLNKK